MSFTYKNFSSGGVLVFGYQILATVLSARLAKIFWKCLGRDFIVKVNKNENVVPIYDLYF